jgi:polysaccharide export outer membrane protein
MLQKQAKLAMVFTVCMIGTGAAPWSAQPMARAQQAATMAVANIEDTGGLSNRKAALVNRTGVVAAPDGFDHLKLTPGYLLQMDIYDVPEMSTSLRIDPQGNVSVPLLGSVHIAGDSLTEAQNLIAKQLDVHEILKKPQVTLNVVEFSATSVSVLGEVESPGRIQLLSPKPLGDVLALAQGETQAAGDDIEIQHRSDTQQVTVRHIKYAQGRDNAPLQSVMIYPGDTVVVQKAGVIYVLGAVTRPGGYLMVNGGTLNVSQAVSLAGGTTLSALTRYAVVVRPEGSAFTQFKVPLKQMETGAALPASLQLNDILYIPTSSWTSASIYRAP